jgi:hypothetical protein
MGLKWQYVDSERVLDIPDAYLLITHMALAKLLDNGRRVTFVVEAFSSEAARRSGKQMLEARGYAYPESAFDGAFQDGGERPTADPYKSVYHWLMLHEPQDGEWDLRTAEAVLE